MANILVTGRRGQLGSEIRDLALDYDDHHFIFTSSDELDICNREELSDFFSKYDIDIIINCTAYTAVDKAEEEYDKALLINQKAIRNLVKCVQQQNLLLFHISTDYVFDGQYFRPYQEDHITNPLSKYGTSKLKGEQEIMDANIRALIIRTSWLYSTFGNNFVKTMLRLGQEKDEIKVIFDQVGTPTYAHDLARTLLDIIDSHKKIKTSEIYHYSNEGVTSWYDFALEILEYAKLECKVIPIRTEEFPLPAKRPFYSILDKSKIKRDFAIEIPNWKHSLHRCLRQLI
ncbi:MAG: dTDP-4-dehydrorhamnose reductase [Bacteroidales bacterium]|nr:dTDP-4-dehydrorhamnose reductase [Bacteroidales bacterium]